MNRKLRQTYLALCCFFIRTNRGRISVPDFGADNMKPLFIAGILLVVLGALALAYQGFNYTHREKVLDVGPIHATKDTQEHVPVPPILGGLALVGGIVLLIAGGKRSA
jgi:hypothetical protein